MESTVFKRLFIISILISAVFLSSCSTMTAVADSWLPEEGGNLPVEGGKLTDAQKELLKSTDRYIGRTDGILEADDRSYSLDCSGLMLAVYYRSGIDLEKCYTEYEGNGVRRLYACLREHELIYYADIPAPGDLVFWDNTYDRNADGKFNDYFSHIGIVTDVDRHGTVTYAHHNYRLGIVYETMNLLHPNNTDLNSPMRMRGSPPAPNGQYLASHLVRVFGRAWKLPGSYWR